jgi:hypothetical protein
MVGEAQRNLSKVLFALTNSLSPQQQSVNKRRKFLTYRTTLHPPPVNRHPPFSSPIHHPPPTTHYPSSIIHHPSSIIHHPSSIIHHPSSIIHHPSSIIHHSQPPKSIMDYDYLASHVDQLLSGKILPWVVLRMIQLNSVHQNRLRNPLLVFANCS